MGSRQSSIESPTLPETTLSVAEDKTQKKKKNKKDLSHLSGPALVEYKCRKKKKAWNNCVGGWYNDRFLPGKALEDERSEENCDDLFDAFRQCYMRRMVAEQRKRGLEIKEGSMLAEFIEEEGDIEIEIKQ